MIGVVIQRPNRNLSPPHMFIHSIGEGLRATIDLCRGCKKFRPGDPANCQINEMFRKVETQTQTRSIRCMCPEFEDQRPPRIKSNATGPAA